MRGNGSLSASEIHKGEESQTSLTLRGKRFLRAADRLPLMNTCIVLWRSSAALMTRYLKVPLLFLINWGEKYQKKRKMYFASLLATSFHRSALLWILLIQSGCLPCNGRLFNQLIMFNQLWVMSSRQTIAFRYEKCNRWGFSKLWSIRGGESSFQVTELTSLSCWIKRTLLPPRGCVNSLVWGECGQGAQ